MLNIPLSEPTFKELRDYIYEKSGIHISDTKKYLIENRLSRIIQENKLNSFEDYLEFIKQGSNGHDLNRLFDAVTTNETYFFREPRQLNVCVEEIIPGILAQKKGAKNVRIWSAACSTGEEPYTISLMLMEKGYLQKQFEIYGSDLSEGVVNSAKQAVYNSYSIRNLPEPHLKKYFSNSGRSYTLSSSVKNTVKFMKVNLIEDKNIKQLRSEEHTSELQSH